MSSPLISFVLMAYNQENYIREAVEGAFAQTYSPLEIILSDDCSRDRTFEIMREMVNAYAGPHKIVLNRNPNNHGIGGHVNVLMTIAQGELIVMAAGDDVSSNNRTERIHDAYIASGATAMAFFSDLILIDEKGNLLKNISSRWPPNATDLLTMCHNQFGVALGASCAFHRRVFDDFGPILTEIISEDRVIPFRAALLGRIRHIDEPLVSYRSHPMNTGWAYRDLSFIETRNTFQQAYWIYVNNERDLRQFLQQIKPGFPMGSRCLNVIQRRRRKLECYLHIYDGNPRAMLISILRMIINRGNPIKAVQLAIKVINHRKQ